MARRRRRTSSLFTPIAVVAALLTAPGCDEPGIRVYEAPKDPPQPARVAADPASQPETQPTPEPTTPGAFTPTAGPDMTWTAPSAWHQAERDVPMRLATYHSRDHSHDEPGIEIAVSAFPGQVGGNLANVNRWREQLGLAPTTQGELDDKLHPFGDEQSVHGWTLRIDTPAGRGMIAAIVRAADVERTWFVRAEAGAASLDAHEQELRDFAMSFELRDDPATSPPPTTTDDPHHHHDHDHAGPELSLSTPDTWRPVADASPIVYAAFEAGPDDAPASVAVTPLIGDGGGVLANVNMWRNQLGLAPLAPDEQPDTQPLEVAGRDATLVDIQGDAGSLVVAIVPDDAHNRTWFFRLAGPPDAVAAQRDAFHTFVTSARFND